MRLSVTTPEGAIVETDVEEVTAPGELGELGILPGHVPLMTALKPGVLTYRTSDHGGVLAVGEGFLQVAPTVAAASATSAASAPATDRVLVLVDQALNARAIDKAGAQRALAAAEAEISDWKHDLDGAYHALLVRRDWALAQIDAATRLGAAG